MKKLIFTLIGIITLTGCTKESNKVRYLGLNGNIEAVRICTYNATEISGEPVTDNLIKVCRYVFDDDGNVKSEKEYDTDGRPTSEIYHTYTKGMETEIKKIHFNWLGEPQEDITTIEYGNGLIDKRVYYSGGEKDHTTITTEDQSNKYHWITKNEDGIICTETFWDSRFLGEDFIKYNVFAGESRPEYKISYIYNEKNQLSKYKIVWYDKNGNIYGEGEQDYKILESDNKGNWTKRAIIDNATIFSIETQEITYR